MFLKRLSPNQVLNAINLALAFRHVNNMPKANPEPDPNRRQTRSKNAFAHPGKIVLEANGKRKPEEIENEKKERNERQKAKAKKKTHIKANNKDIAQFEHQMVLDDKAQEARIPRHETDGKLKPTRGMLLTFIE